MSERILIFGKGFIGNRIKEELGCESCDEIISSFKDADDKIKKVKPSLIINCIGYTGGNVDECELDIQNTLAANAFVPLILAEAALRNNIKLVHISSGCIYHYDYSHDAPIDEDKEPDFFDLFYSRTKIYSERALSILSKKYPILIARIRIPMDNCPHPKNIIDKLVRYKQVIDIPNSITYIPDFIEALKHLISVGAKGVYNVVNKGALRYPQLLDTYKKYVPSFEYKIVDFKELNLVRTNLIMSTKKLELSGFKVRDIHEVLEECVKNYVKF